MKITSYLKCLLILPIFLIVGCNVKDNDNVLAIACASNMQFAMQEIIEQFSEKTNTKCQLILGSSGKLTAQISEGAPYDLFISADMKYPEELYQKGLTTSKPQVYALGKLVLWTLNAKAKPAIENLKNEEIRHIALANPKTAPYGRAAIEVLNFYQQFNSLKNKLVYGESISQTNQFILSNVADIGFTAMSVVHSPELKEKGNWIMIDTNSYKPIEQGIVIINRENGKNKDSKAFYDFVFSKEAREILLKYGYSINE